MYLSTSSHLLYVHVPALLLLFVQFSIIAVQGVVFSNNVTLEK